MNNLQKVASAISGKENFDGGRSLRADACDDVYYSMTSKEEKISRINEYAEEVLGIYLSEKQAEKIFVCLEEEAVAARVARKN